MSALRHAVHTEIGRGVTIRIVAAPFFLATKLEAFFGRGRDDFLASHDLEDIIAVFDGRKEIVAEVKSVPEEVRAFLVGNFDALLQNRDFLDALPGYLPPDATSRKRAMVVFNRIREIAQAG